MKRILFIALLTVLLLTACGAGATRSEARAPAIADVHGVRVGFLGRAEDCPQLAGKGFPGPALIEYPQVVEDVRALAKVEGK